jgi:hypothetical protein
MRMLAAAVLTTVAVAQDLPTKGWTKGEGYGAVYGKDDQVGALNAIINAAHVLRAPKDVKTGRIYDLGVRLDRTSFKWPGHSPTEIMSFRSPDGLRRGKDLKPFVTNPNKVAFNSCALFISDNVGTQIDGLGHIAHGEDAQIYNGFKIRDVATDFGLMKNDADSIPPIIGRAVMIDVAGWKGVDALPNHVIPVHEYLLLDQGMHVLEFHNLEQLAHDKVYRFTYIATTNRLKGTVAGTALRPIAIQ